MRGGLSGGLLGCAWNALSESAMSLAPGTNGCVIWSAGTAENTIDWAHADARHFPIGMPQGACDGGQQSCVSASMAETVTSGWTTSCAVAWTAVSAGSLTGAALAVIAPAVGSIATESAISRASMVRKERMAYRRQNIGPALMEIK